MESGRAPCTRGSPTVGRMIACGGGGNNGRKIVEFRPANASSSGSESFNSPPAVFTEINSREGTVAESDEWVYMCVCRDRRAGDEIG